MVGRKFKLNLSLKYLKVQCTFIPGTPSFETQLQIIYQG